MSVAADDDLYGVNLLKPGKTPHQNLRFLMFLAAVLKAVHKHSGLLRAGIASSGNEHRLGANEAPPAIISVFMGDLLTRVIDDIAAGKTGGQSAQQAMIKLGIDKLPEIARDNTDRNRTSPFAFTGVKFEFRAVGGSASIAFPVMILNATVADALGDLTDKLRAELKKTRNTDDAVLKVVRAAFKESADVRFEGNNYSEAWVKEAKKRGLLNLRSTPEALTQMTTKAARDLFARLGILSNEELEARYNVRVERYIKDILIELHTIEQMAHTQILPAALAYLGDLSHSAAQAKVAGLKPIPQLSDGERGGQVGRGTSKAGSPGFAARSRRRNRCTTMHRRRPRSSRPTAPRRWPRSAKRATRSNSGSTTRTGRSRAIGKCSSRSDAGSVRAPVRPADSDASSQELTCVLYSRHSWRFAAR